LFCDDCTAQLISAILYVSVEFQF